MNWLNKNRQKGSESNAAPLVGAGKTSNLIIPTSLRDQGNFVVIDPALDLYELRPELGNDVVVLCPFLEDAAMVDACDAGLGNRGGL